jgi:hypothetical protein
MALIAVIAADLAALRAVLPITLPVDPGAVGNASLPPTFWREHLPTFPDLGLVLMIVVLEVGLFRLFSRRGGDRAFWIGFEVAGWAYVITCLAYAPTAWSLAYSLFEGRALGRPMGRPFDMGRFILFAGGLHLLISLVIAFFVGILARSAWHRSGAISRRTRPLREPSVPELRSQMDVSR